MNLRSKVTVRDAYQLEARMDQPDSGAPFALGPPRQASRSSVWVYIRTGGRRYSVEVQRTVPIGDGQLLNYPHRFQAQLGEQSTLAELLEMLQAAGNRAVWHPYEDFLPVSQRCALTLEQKPSTYLYSLRMPEISKRAPIVLGQITYEGRSPDIGHGVGLYELSLVAAYRWTAMCDRMSEASHLICLAYGLVERAPQVTYLCDVPTIEGELLR